MGKRNRSSQEMYAMGFADLAANASEDGWAYPDDDDEETTEGWLSSGRKSGVARDEKFFWRDDSDG